MPQNTNTNYYAHLIAPWKQTMHEMRSSHLDRDSAATLNRLELSNVEKRNNIVTTTITTTSQHDLTYIANRDRYDYYKNCIVYLRLFSDIHDMEIKFQLRDGGEPDEGMRTPVPPTSSNKEAAIRRQWPKIITELGNQIGIDMRDTFFSDCLEVTVSFANIHTAILTVMTSNNIDIINTYANTLKWVAHNSFMLEHILEDNDVTVVVIFEKKSLNKAVVQKQQPDIIRELSDIPPPPDNFGGDWGL